MKLKWRVALEFLLLMGPMSAILADNLEPVVQAGPDVVTTSFTVRLNGQANDDGLPNPPGQLNTNWALLYSSPSSQIVVFEDQTNPTSTAAFSGEGLYILELKADDSELTAADQVIIKIEGESIFNKPPQVNAGPDIGMVWTGSTTIALDGTVTDDGLPVPPGAVTSEWAVLFSSSPPPYIGAAVFADKTDPKTLVTFLTPGVYILGLKSFDGQLYSQDETTIVQSLNDPPPPGVDSPKLNAGNDISLVWPQSVGSLQGKVLDDGLPDPTQLIQTKWLFLFSFPDVSESQVIFDNPNNLNTDVHFPNPGQYFIALQGYNGYLFGQDGIRVTVLPENANNTPPTVQAGNDITINWPDNQADLRGQVLDDGLPGAPYSLTTQWSFLFGIPSVGESVLITDPQALGTGVMLPRPGIYIFSLSATDGLLSGQDWISVTVENENEAAAPLPQSPIEEVIIFPSPAKDRVGFMYSLPNGGDVKIKIFDRLGLRVAEIDDFAKTSDTSSVTFWDAHGVAPGGYYALIELNHSDGIKNIIKRTLIIER